MNLFSFSQPTGCEWVASFSPQTFLDAFGDRCCGSIRQIIVDKKNGHICFIASYVSDFNHHSFFIDTVIRRCLLACEDTDLTQKSSFRYYCDDAIEGEYGGLFAGPFIVHVFKTGEWWDKEKNLPNFVSADEILALIDVEKDSKLPGLFQR